MYAGFSEFFKVKPEKKDIFFIISISLIFAGTDEIHQRYVPGRNCDIYDFLSDTFAILCGVSLMFWWKNIFKYLKLLFKKIFYVF